MGKHLHFVSGKTTLSESEGKGRRTLLLEKKSFLKNKIPAGKVLISWAELLFFGWEVISWRELDLLEEVITRMG